ncbi:MAG TPA: hypothetical protein VFX30_00035 [bacterium]|nr:hypothetical protein [bacterium]
MSTNNYFLGRVDMGKPTPGNDYDPADLIRIQTVDENGRASVKQVRADYFVNSKEFEGVGTPEERRDYVTKMDWINRPVGGSHAKSPHRYTQAILKSGRAS